MMKASCPFLLCLLAAMPLVSCRIVGTKADFSGMADIFTPAKEDNVIVEGRTPVATTAAAPAPAPAASPAATSAPATAPGSYVVRPGDTLSSIARHNGVSLAALMSANGMSPASVIKPGQALRLPGKAQPAAKLAPAPAPKAAAAAPAVPAPKPAPAAAPRSTATSYTMQAGDTLSGVARKHGVSLQALLKANEITEASARFVQPGATLNIPSQH